MKRKLFIALLSVAIAILISSAVLYFAPRKSKPSYEKVDFEINASLKPWQTLFVKSGSDYILCSKVGNIYTASIIKHEDALLRYTFVLGDEWGNVYNDAATDVFGERLTRQTLIRDTASFDNDLSGYKELEVSFTVSAEPENELYISVDGELTPLSPCREGSYFCPLALGIGEHSVRIYCKINGELVPEIAPARNISVSRYSVSFDFDSGFVYDTKRTLTLRLTFASEPVSAYLFLEDGRLIKAERTVGAFSVGFTIPNDCMFSVFVSSTEDETGISYDSVFTGNTADLSDAAEINL